MNLTASGGWCAPIETTYATTDCTTGDWYTTWQPNTHATGGVITYASNNERSNVNITIKTTSYYDGFVGQITSNGKIVWESKNYKTSAKAQRKAQEHLDQRLANLFAEEN